MHTVLVMVFTVFSLASFSGILLGADPYSSDPFIRVLFFVTLFFALAGVLALLHLWGSAILRKPLSHEVAFRRGLLLSALSVSLIALETFSVLNLGNALATLMLVIALEMLAVYKK